MKPDQVIKQLTDELRTDPPSVVKRIDDLLLRQTGNNSHKVELLLLASRANIMTGKYDVGEPLARQALVASQHLQHRQLEGRSHNELGIYRFVEYDFDQAIVHYAHALRLFDGINAPVDQAKVYTNLGNVYMRQNRHFEAAQAYGKALELLEGGIDILAETKVLMNLSSLYQYVLYDSETAIEYTNRVIALFRMLNDKSGLAKALHNKAQILRQTNQLDECYALYKEALQLKQMFSEPVDLALNYSGLIATLINQQKFTEAETTLQEGLDLLDKIGANDACNYLLLPLTALYRNKGQTDKALETIQTLYKWIQETKMDEFLVATMEAEIDVLSDLGEYKRCTELLIEVNKLNNSVAREQAKMRLLYVKQQIEYVKVVGREEAEQIKNTELAQTINKLKAVVRENEEYFTFLAHELKAPLSAIRSVAGLLATEPKVTEAEGKEYSTEIMNISTRMLDMISRVLAGSRMTLMQQKAVVDAKVPFQHVVTTLSIMAKQKGIHFDWSVPTLPVMVSADEQALHMIFENLVSNAIKFTPTGGVIKTSLRVTSPVDSDPTMVFSVLDTGPGISDSDRLLLYQAFVPLTATPTAHESSSGLGLHLVRRATEQIGARLWCESEMGRGAMFFVEMPISSTEGYTKHD